MRKVLLLNGQYLPGYKGGGPIQSCVNMVENLSDHYSFYVICADRDYKEEKAYDNIRVNEWNPVGSAQVYYMSPDRQSLRGFEDILNETDYDILYLNGFFSPIFTIRPLILRCLGKLKNRKAKIILTAHGDFTGGCENKKLKKYSYIWFAKMTGLYKDLTWHATSEIEERDVRQKFPHANIFMVPNLPARLVLHESQLIKEGGKLRLVFISRIFPKKNLKYALELLRQVKEGQIIFDIYGPMEDAAYWKECESVMDKMPSNVRVSYCGEAEHKDIPHIFEQYHAFLFPTLGENYGYVIEEAMMNNCLCILSKGVTPWDDYIEALHLGAELQDSQKFIRDIREMVKWDQQIFEEKLSEGAHYITQKSSPADLIPRYLQLFS